MKIEKIEQISKIKYRLYFSNGEVVDTYEEVLVKYHLLSKLEISKELYSNLIHGTEFFEYYMMCLKYIEVRLRSVKEIKDYLFKKKVSQEMSEEIILKLLKEGYLNDEKFCECFIKDKVRFTTMGSYRIKMELQKYEISNEVIEKYSYLMDEEIMREKILKIIHKQICSNRKLDCYKLRNRLYRQLLNLGFEHSLVVEMLNESF